jgi:hypothetical protein
MNAHSIPCRNLLPGLLISLISAAFLAGCSLIQLSGSGSQAPSDMADLRTGGAQSAVPCQVSPGSPPLPDLQNPLTWASEVLQYLNDGGLLTTLLESLEARPSALEPDQTGAVLDLSADGREDLALILTQQDSISGMLSGTLFIFLCDKDRYELAYLTPPGETEGVLAIQSTHDLNADGTSDLLVSTQTCGAHTCFQNLQVLSYAGKRFENLLQGRSDDLPNPTLELRGPGTDGRWSLALTGTGISSVGAGPYRERTRTWTWDPAAGVFIAVPDALGVPRYRIHLLQDADSAAEAGDFPTALELYQQVIEDERYDDWVYGDGGRRTLAAFAVFRQMWIHLSQGDTGAARRSLDFLGASATNDTADILTLAEVTFEAFETGGMEAACSAAQAYGAAHASSVLEPLNYGYANRAYSPPDLCLLPE